MPQQGSTTSHDSKHYSDPSLTYIGLPLPNFQVPTTPSPSKLVCVRFVHWALQRCTWPLSPTLAQTAPSPSQAQGPLMDLLFGGQPAPPSQTPQVCDNRAMDRSLGVEMNFINLRCWLYLHFQQATPIKPQQEVDLLGNFASPQVRLNNCVFFRITCLLVCLRLPSFNQLGPNVLPANPPKHAWNCRSLPPLQPLSPSRCQIWPFRPHALP